MDAAASEGAGETAAHPPTLRVTRLHRRPRLLAAPLGRRDDGNDEGDETRR